MDNQKWIMGFENRPALLILYCLVTNHGPRWFFGHFGLIYSLFDEIRPKWQWFYRLNN